MRVITQQTTGGPEVLELAEIEAPTPGPGEVRLTTTAIGVNPVDIAVRAGIFALLGQPPFTLGWDVAGVVDAVGSGVNDFVTGDRAFGMPRFPAAASGYAEQVLAPAVELAPTPDGLDDVHAAALPLVGLTAWQALVEVAGIGPDARVLVQAAGGGVGHVAIQIAKALGAEVVATASPRKTEFVHRLGADEIVDYTTTSLATTAPVQAAIDPFGGENTLHTVEVVLDGGVVAVLVGEPDHAARAAAAARGIQLVRTQVVPNPTALTALVDLVHRGKLSPHVQATYALDRVADAHVELENGVRGKLVLVP